MPSFTVLERALMFTVAGVETVFWMANLSKFNPKFKMAKPFGPEILYLGISSIEVLAHLLIFSDCS